jgi:ABC-type uncharacterized transport system involved in gliding motility auxiliary subunit
MHNSKFNMKGISISRRSLRFLAWPGLALTTAGLVSGSLTGWQLLPAGLFVLGLGLLFVGLSFSGGAFWQQRSTQAGTNAVLAVGAMVVILGLVNFLGVRYSQRLDLTENQLFTLAPATQQIATTLDQPVKVVVFDVAPNPQDRQLLESYARLTPQFTYEYVDPYANPQQAQAFGVTAPGMVFLEVGGDLRFLQAVGTPDPQGAGTPERLSERRLTNALDQVINDRSLTVYFVQGHEEYAIDGSETGYFLAATGLEDKNYTVNPLNLAESQTVPEDASVVVVAGPAQDFFAAEVEALETYLDQGGGVLLLLDPRTDGGLGPILNEWGVVLDDRLVLDTSGAGQFVGLGPAAPIVSDYGDHPITQDFASGRSFFPLVRPVETREVPDITATPLLLTNPQSQAEAISDEGDLSFDPNAAPEGPYTLGVALSRPAEAVTETVSDREDDADEETAEDADLAEASDLAETETPEAAASAPETADEAPAEGEDEPPEAGAEDSVPEAEADTAEPETDDAAPEESRLVVIGNSSFASDGLFEQQLNGDVFLNSVSWLGEAGDDALSIRPKAVTDRRILITPQQQMGLGIFSLLLLPLSGIALAVVMWLRRR